MIINIINKESLLSIDSCLTIRLLSHLYILINRYKNNVIVSINKNVVLMGVNITNSHWYLLGADYKKKFL